MEHLISWTFFCQKGICRLSIVPKPSSGLFTITWKILMNPTPSAMIIRVQMPEKLHFCTHLPTHKSRRRMSIHRKRLPGVKRCPPKETLFFRGWYLHPNMRRMPELQLHTSYQVPFPCVIRSSDRELSLRQMLSRPRGQ